VSAAGGCDDCGSSPALLALTGVGTFCDRCADQHVAQFTGFPQFGEPPAPVVLSGVDGRAHRLVFRLLRGPAGITVELTEAGAGGNSGDGGYEFSVVGAHDADVATLTAAVTAIAQQEIGRQYLRPAQHRAGWTVTEQDEVAGRLVFNPDGGPYGVVVDGRELSWEELGEALDSFEGWRFRLIIDDPGVDLRPDADIVALPTASNLNAAPPLTPG
jgi:hypothetical protein